MMVGNDIVSTLVVINTPCHLGLLLCMSICVRLSQVIQGKFVVSIPHAMVVIKSSLRKSSSDESNSRNKYYLFKL